MECHEMLPGLVINTKDKNTFMTEMSVIFSNLIFLVCPGNSLDKQRSK